MDRRRRTRVARSSANWRCHCISCVVIKVSELKLSPRLDGNAPIFSVNATLDGVAVIINHEDDRLETEADHSRNLLDGQLTCGKSRQISTDIQVIRLTCCHPQ
jgi:hypothetical protein